jgi:translation initiation factor 2-alpha kinase 4
MMFSISNDVLFFQKVDIYSLGIIFFEMCSPPLTTGMERVKVLGDLRSDGVLLPENFSFGSTTPQVQIIK